VCENPFLSFRSGLKGGAFSRNTNDSRFVLSNPDSSGEKSLMKSTVEYSLIKMLGKMQEWINGYKESGVFDVRRAFLLITEAGKDLGLVRVILRLGESSK
jgi:hypothetical protein